MTDAAPDRDWWVVAGMATAAVSAAVASFAGLRGLAEAAGWPARLAWLLPVTIDAYAITSARVWLAGSAGTPGARQFARANALGAITASIAGNAAYHAIGVRLLAVSWPIVVLVGAVPAAVLGLTAHLHALRSRTGPGPSTPDSPEPAESRTGDRTEAGPESRTEAGPDGGPTPARTRNRTPTSRRPRTEAELLAAARAADDRHRAEHGRPITRDALRAALRISGSRATELRRALAQPPDPDAHPVIEPDATPAVADRKEAVTRP
ncbi:MAG TPA: DUF2637 domain-containing protein [Mycobacteriales bacterium]|nr:DUF2637 domain-containing protein [Mycobacteriales bacterium]